MTTETKPQHTPGPWKQVCQQICEPTEIVSAAGNIVAFAPLLGLPHTSQAKETQANANLIAAAPELLEALEMAAKILWSDRAIDAYWGAEVKPEFDSIKESIRKALAKAKGG